MASKRAIRRKECGGKMRYTSAANASEARHMLNARKGYQGQLNVYKCGFCGGYHFGHAKYHKGA